MKETLLTTPQCCIAYTTDTLYLFPTLVSAMQARRHSSPATADVIVFCIGLQETTRQIFSPVCERENIRLLSVDSQVVEGQTAMLARLFLNRYVPEQYTQYLYLDGDVHIFGSLDPLINASVPPGCFLAANDPMTFLLQDSTLQSKDLSRHLASMGFSREQSLNYFNSGVLRINRDGWDATGQASWRFYQANAVPSRFPDQDALNLAGMGKRLPMSLMWNFPVFMRNSRVELAIKPCITHFMSSPKPWHGSFPPWKQESCTPYDDALRSYPELIPFKMNMPLKTRAVYHLQQRAKKWTETITWGYSERRGRILSYEAACLL